MTPFEQSLEKARLLNLKVVENYDLSVYGDLEGLILDGYVFLSNKLQTDAEKHYIIEEEIAHHIHNTGNILDQSKVANRRQEQIARKASILNVVPLIRLVTAIVECGEDATYDNVAMQLGIKTEYLKECIEFYENSFDGMLNIGDYTIHFSPFRVCNKEQYD